ncbi:Mu-like prophage DNA circulation protein [Commensalibacter communis]|uniref:Mu-like prophage DNA circulation protein n=1 Tax=Commensalibacter communis TaxID=2972786 RepID=A0A9W4X7B3_9PROT|nr:hypothetical protein [Commensalibacter communis]CAI3953398.1 Mu-like prophage DNA circulation protein [Commensalibacter communis]CAI3956468.1 Mu-like prophage DNA circulation protein [Commensalibacter communis]CAI3956782.1 Mu-like prophage DNA circulation protein [Commensalibacter communis]CAI3957188.1 Mu-like prophage DNA circulation protein [Commensalibacter communis]
MATAAELANAITDLPEILLQFSNDPKTQMALLFPLCEYQVKVVETIAPLGQAENRLIKATAALCRRAAMKSLCKAISNWQADSWDEVVEVRRKVSNLLNNEILLATEDKNMSTVNALRALRVKVLEGLLDAAGDLPHLRTITRNNSLPALQLSQQLYADGNRATELIKRANPIHPAFMPTTLEVLSS